MGDFDLPCGIRSERFDHQGFAWWLRKPQKERKLVSSTLWHLQTTPT